MKRLLVVLNERISVWIAKGEVVPRYYNPGDVFDEVHLLLLNDDRPDVGELRHLTGRAEPVLHNLPADDLFYRTLGWRPALLRPLVRSAQRIADQVGPDVIRCHGTGLNAFVAAQVGRKLDVPVVVSLHGNPDVDYLRGRLARTWRHRVLGAAVEAVERKGVQGADLVLPVYSPIVPFLERCGVERWELLANVVGIGIEPKASYGLHRPARLLCVGRQVTMEKDPRPIIEAVSRVPDVTLTLIGNGDLHDDLVRLADRLDVADRVRFITSLANTEVLAEMAAADLWVYASINHELSKGTMEAALLGLPLVIGDRPDGLADELRGEHTLVVPATAAGFADAIRDLLDDDERREALGRAARRHALDHWEPEATERRAAAHYERLLSRA